LKAQKIQGDMIVLGSKRLIKSIRLRNFLSFGDNAKDIYLESLNVQKTGTAPLFILSLTLYHLIITI